MLEDRFDYELVPSNTLTSYRNESTHTVITTAQNHPAYQEPIVQEVVSRLEQAEDYFYEREKEADKLDELLGKILVENVKDLDGSGPDYWSNKASHYMESEEIIETLRDYIEYLQYVINDDDT